MFVFLIGLLVGITLGSVAAAIATVILVARKLRDIEKDVQEAERICEINKRLVELNEELGQKSQEVLKLNDQINASWHLSLKESSALESMFSKLGYGVCVSHAEGSVLVLATHSSGEVASLALGASDFEPEED